MTRLAQCSLMKFLFKANDPPRFADDFLNAVTRIIEKLHLNIKTDDSIEKEWHNLFDQFGTHYIKEMTTGSKARLITVMTSEEKQSYVSFSYMEKEAWSMSAGFGETEGQATMEKG